MRRGIGETVYWMNDNEQVPVLQYLQIGFTGKERKSVSYQKVQ